MTTPLRLRKESMHSHNNLKVSVSKRRLSCVQGQSMADATVKVPEKTRTGRDKSQSVVEESGAKIPEKLDLGKISEE